MKRPRICAAITHSNIAAIEEVEPLVDYFEVRIDLIGDAWQDIAKALKKPWIACNRLQEEGGRWQDNEARRIEKLLQAVEIGANVVDIELRTRNLENIVSLIKKRAGCLISSHDFEKTPSLSELKSIVDRQFKAGADICKVVSTAKKVEDNWTIIQLISEHPDTALVSFAMGPLGALSRVLSPLAGGYFTYASIETGKESAPGQVTVAELARLYEMLGFGLPSDVANT